MKREPNVKLQFASRCSPWRWTFAWIPLRTLDGRWIWLAPVMVARFHLHDYITDRRSDEWNGYWFPWGYARFGEGGGEVSYPKRPRHHDTVDAIFAAIDVARVSVHTGNRIKRRSVTIVIPITESGDIDVARLNDLTERKRHV